MELVRYAMQVSEPVQCVYLVCDVGHHPVSVSTVGDVAHHPVSVSTVCVVGSPSSVCTNSVCCRVTIQ